MCGWLHLTVRHVADEAHVCSLSCLTCAVNTYRRLIHSVIGAAADATGIPPEKIRFPHALTAATDDGHRGVPPITNSSWQSGSALRSTPSQNVAEQRRLLSGMRSNGRGHEPVTRVEAGHQGHHREPLPEVVAGDALGASAILPRPWSGVWAWSAILTRDPSVWRRGCASDGRCSSWPRPVRLSWSVR